MSNLNLPGALRVAMLVPLLGACSVRGYATRTLADTFSAAGTGYSSDEDPELVAAAVPFALKTMEQILPEQPRHVGLLTSLSSGFTAYSYAFVQQDADQLEDKDFARSQDLKTRARKLYLRARDYGLRGLDVQHAGAEAAFREGATEAARAKILAACTKDDVPLLYWTAASWTLAITDGKDNMKLVGELPMAEALVTRALALDESWDEGTIHEFFIAYDAARPATEGGGIERVKAHYARALSLAKNKKLGPIVSYAEAVSVPSQNKAEFTELLEKVVAADVNADLPHRLANVVAQRRARWLLTRVAELFAE